MNTTFKTLALTIGLLILVGCSQVFVAGQSGQGTVARVEGVWRTVVTLRNCETGNPLGLTFPGILMFDQGGTMTGTSTAVSSAYGVWKREAGAREYSFASISQKFENGVLVGSRRITQNVSLDDSGNSLTSTGGFQDYDLAGNPTTAGCSTSAGVRFQ